MASGTIVKAAGIVIWFREDDVVEEVELGARG
jgi:hypothetical protein